jgi:hypothetical protein
VTYYATPGTGADHYETHWIDLGLISEVVIRGDQTAAPAQDSAG